MCKQMTLMKIIRHGCFPCNRSVQWAPDPKQRPSALDTHYAMQVNVAKEPQSMSQPELEGVA